MKKTWGGQDFSDFLSFFSVCWRNSAGDSKLLSLWKESTQAGADKNRSHISETFRRLKVSYTISLVERSSQPELRWVGNTPKKSKPSGNKICCISWMIRQLWKLWNWRPHNSEAALAHAVSVASKLPGKNTGGQWNYWHLSDRFFYPETKCLIRFRMRRGDDVVGI